MLPARRFNGLTGLPDFFNDFFDNGGIERISTKAPAINVIEDDKLIIMGAFSVVETADGLYLDCAPDVDWEQPVQSGNVLYLTQVYGATKNGNVLEVE